MSDTRRVLLIVNPAADSGRLAGRVDEIGRVFLNRFRHVIVCPTEGRGHARRLAARGRDFDLVAAVGGDGTVHETALGLADHDIRIPLAVIPLGTGNDFGRMLGMVRRVEKAVGQIADGTPVDIDTGTVTWSEEGSRRTRGFVNAVGIGLTAMTAYRAPNYKRWPLNLGYSAAALDALVRWRSVWTIVHDLSPAEAEVVAAGERILFDGPLLFATIGNARDSGGGYSLTPEARLADGHLDACLVRHMSIVRAVALMPAARRGTHIRRKAVTYGKVVHVRLESDGVLPIHTDGEVITTAARDIEVLIRRRSLRVIVAAAGMKNL